MYVITELPKGNPKPVFFLFYVCGWMDEMSDAQKEENLRKYLSYT